MLTKILKQGFGHKAFRGNQREIIESILSGRDTLVIMATGSGKSLCYQLPAVAQEGMAIVISPLIALMKNQVDALNAKNIRAACLNSSIPKKVLHTIKEEVTAQKIKLLYIAPETLNKEETIELLKTTKISFIAVDEAHCISDWGHDFRPEYRNTRKAIKALGNPPIIALTATATPKVQNDILKSLEMKDSAVLKSTFYRSNLHYKVIFKQQAEKKIVAFIKQKIGQAGIIYCHSRKKAEQLAELLQLNGLNAAAYHAGLDAKTRARNQDLFLQKKIDIIVATIAFGMGIDKADVRYIIHYDAPKSLEGYYQETGRAGRDGQDAECVFFYDPDDILKLQKLNRNKTASERENGNRLLHEVASYATSALCRTKQLLHYFGEVYEGTCGHCDNCQEERKTYEAKDIVSLLLHVIKETKQKYNQKDLIKILLGVEEEHFTLDKSDKLESFGKGEKYTSSQWLSILKQLLVLEYIHIENRDLDIVELTSKGEKFLEKPHAIRLLEDLTYVVEANENGQNQNATENFDQKLFDKLIELRDKVASKENLKPYLVFQEKALKMLASYYPTTIAQLGQMTNVGISKAHKFGKPFIELIQKHIEAHNIQPPTHIVVKATTAKSSKKIHLIQQIDRKTNLKEIAKQNNMSYEDLIKELEEICYSGIKLNLDYYINKVLDEELQDDLYSYFEDAEEDNIEQAFEDLEDEFSEEEIRLMHIKFLSEMAY